MITSVHSENKESKQIHYSRCVVKQRDIGEENCEIGDHRTRGECKY